MQINNRRCFSVGHMWINGDRLVNGPAIPDDIFYIMIYLIGCWAAEQNLIVERGFAFHESTVDRCYFTWKTTLATHEYSLDEHFFREASLLAIYENLERDWSYRDPQFARSTARR